MPMPSDGEITLRIASVNAADETKGVVPAYKFEIVRLSDDAVVGETDLRLGYVRNLYFGGNIGYAVKEPYRGNAYAGKACKLVFEIARKHVITSYSIHYTKLYECITRVASCRSPSC